MNVLPTRNVDLLDQTLEHVTKLAAIVDEHYEGDKHLARAYGLDIWEQSVWLMKRNDSCGTAACFAGWATILAGDVRSYGIDDQAQKLLGLNDHEAAQLFFSCNDLEDLSRVVQNIKDGMYR